MPIKITRAIRGLFVFLLFAFSFHNCMPVNFSQKYDQSSEFDSASKGVCNLKELKLISNPPNQASFLPGQEVEISIESTDSKGKALNFSQPVWVLPDGKIENTESVKIKLETEGRHNVEVDLAEIDLSSNTNATCFNRLHQKISFVVNKACPEISNIAISGSQLGYVGIAMEFSVAGVSDCMNIKGYTWDFADNTKTSKIEFANGGLAGLKKKVQHIYQKPGTYQIQLSITSHNAKAGTAPTIITQQVLIKYPGPFDWFLKDKGTCSVKACGLKGTQKMTFACIDARKVEIDPENCNLQEKPNDLLECSTDACPITTCQNGAKTFPSCKDCPSGKYLDSKNQCIPTPFVNCSLNLAADANSQAPMIGALKGTKIYAQLNLTNAKTADYVCTGMNKNTALNLVKPSLPVASMGTQNYSCKVNYTDLENIKGSCSSNSVTYYVCSPNEQVKCASVTNGSSQKTCKVDGSAWGDCTLTCVAGYHVSGTTCVKDACVNGTTNYPTCDSCPSGKYLSSKNTCDTIPAVKCSAILASTKGSQTPATKIVAGSKIYPTVTLSNAQSATYLCTGMNSPASLSTAQPVINELTMGDQELYCTINYKNLGSVDGTCVSNKVATQLCTANSTMSCGPISNGTSTKTCSSNGTSWSACVVKCNSGYHVNGNSCEIDACKNGATDAPTCKVCPSGKYLSSKNTCDTIPAVKCSAILASTKGSQTPATKIVAGSKIYPTVTLSNAQSATYLCTGMNSPASLSTAQPVINELTMGEQELSCTINYKNLGSVDGTCVSNKVATQLCTANSTMSCGPISNGTSTKTCSSDGSSWSACVVKCNSGYHVNGNSCEIDACKNGATDAPACKVCPSGKVLINNVCEFTPVVNGKCGSSNGLNFAEAPKTELCASGTPIDVIGGNNNGTISSWSWSCKGINGGNGALATNATCGAKYQFISTTCAKGTWDVTLKKCKLTEIVSENVTSNKITAKSCNDHHGLLDFKLQTKGSIDVTFYNFSPSYVAGWGCSYKSKAMGTINLISSTGRDMTQLKSLSSITVKYSSSGTGCKTRSGTFVLDNPSDYKLYQGKELYYVSLCPSDGAQTASVNAEISGQATFEIDTYTNPVCAPGATYKDGFCLK